MLPKLELSVEVTKVSAGKDITFVPDEPRDITPIAFELLELGYDESLIKKFLEKELEVPWDRIEITHQFRCIWHKQGNSPVRDRLKAKVAQRDFKPTMLNCFLYWCRKIRPVYETTSRGDKMKIWKQYY